VYQRKLSLLVTFIQKWIRMWLVRKKYKERKGLEAVARIIQRRIRQYVVVKCPKFE
jgi:IQ calmodulin-binding motif